MIIAAAIGGGVGGAISNKNHNGIAKVYKIEACEGLSYYSDLFLGLVRPI